MKTPSRLDAREGARMLLGEFAAERLVGERHGVLAVERLARRHRDGNHVDLERHAGGEPLPRPRPYRACDAIPRGR